MSIPSAPSNIVLQTGNAQNFLSWPIVSGATSYLVQRSTDGVTFSALGSASVNSYLDSAPVVGTNYYYQVAAVYGYVFTVTSANATVGATYTNNAHTFTVLSTIAGATTLYMSATGAPGVSGTLTKASGTGDATITFSVAAVAVTSYSASAPVSIVACSPGQINLGYLRYLAQLRADMQNSQFLSLDEWNSNINQSAYELYDILVTKFGDQYFLSPPISFATTGASSYPLPDGVTNIGGSVPPAMYRLVGVDCGVAVGNNAWVTLPRFNWIDRNRFIYPQLQANALGVFNLSYCPWGNNLYFIPRPSAGQFIQLWYVPMMTQMLQDSDMLPFSISGWSEYIIVDAAIKALIKEESDISGLSMTKAALLERIETTAANRDVGQPNCISDTRSNTGFYDGGGFGGTGSGMAGW